MQRAAVLYPINSTTVDTGAGIDVRALSNTEPGATDASQSIQNAVQNSSVERRFDPATALDTTVVNAATTNDKKGWAIPLAGMAPDSAQCVAVLFAQTLTIHWDGTAQGTGAGNAGAQDTFTGRASLWKYNVTTNVATLIVGGSDSTGTSFSAVLAYGPTTYDADVVLSVPLTTFAADEVLMIVYGGQMVCGAGLLGGARTFTVTMNVDLPAGTATFASSGLSQKCTLSAPGALDLGAVYADTVKFKKAVAAALDLAGAYSRILRMFHPYSATLDLNAAYARRLVLKRSAVGTLDLNATYSRLLHFFHTYTAALDLNGSLSKTTRYFRAYSAGLDLNAAYSRVLTGYRSFAAALDLNAAYSRLLTLKRSAVATLDLNAARGPWLIRLRNAGLVATLDLNAARSFLHRRAFAAGLDLDAAYSRMLTGFRAFTAALDLNAGYSRIVRIRKTFTGTLDLGAELFVKISQTILNRMVSGGTTIIKKAPYIFDD